MTIDDIKASADGLMQLAKEKIDLHKKKAKGFKLAYRLVGFGDAIITFIGGVTAIPALASSDTFAGFIISAVAFVISTGLTIFALAKRAQCHNSTYSLALHLRDRLKLLKTQCHPNANLELLENKLAELNVDIAKLLKQSAECLGEEISNGTD
ncbi:MAG: hypothetical protein ACTSO7_18150 [Candidatus Heimdallarchaeota archaeon]